MQSVWAVYDYERYDTHDSDEPHLVALFQTQADALDTRKRLEQREHPASGLGYRYHFEIREHPVHGAAMTEADIERGCADTLAPTGDR